MTSQDPPLFVSAVSIALIKFTITFYLTSKLFQYELSKLRQYFGVETLGVFPAHMLSYQHSTSTTIYVKIERHAEREEIEKKVK